MNIIALTAASAAAALAPLPAPPAPPPIFVPAPPPAAPWPPGRPVRVLSTPDWSDPHVYPIQALRHEQEGLVRFEMLIGTSGFPRECRIVTSSGFPALDEGTCALAMRMRFAPPQDEDGKPVETVFRRAVRWRISDARSLDVARAVARLEFEAGAVRSCTFDGLGAVPQGWTSGLCQLVVGHLRYYFPGDRQQIRRGTVVLSLVPTGSAPTGGPLAAGREIARRRIEFGLTRGGDISACRTTIDQGFGQPDLDQLGPCDLLLMSVWVKPKKEPGSPTTGVLHVAVYAE